MMLQRKLSIAIAGVAVLAATAGFTGHGPHWQLTDTGVTARFRGLADLLDPVRPGHR